MEVKKCPKARKRTGRKAKPQVIHDSHIWLSGVYHYLGEVDGIEALCPGWQG